ncbi:MAG: fibrobacter succinogenes major paralogous domain-containing protein [Bacteroidales bacterium]|nr:fibrobacter succinogenes major paralogous domain-containing protein [Bacteroidales bacterium]
MAGGSLPDEEWTILSDYLGGEINSGSTLKETGTIHWASPNSWASNTSGFSGLPGGWRDIPGSFNEITLNGSFWTSSQLSSSIGNIRYLIVDDENLATGNTEKSKRHRSVA